MTKPLAIPLVAVKSGAVSHIGYDAASRTLALTFKSGANYHYHDVAPELHQELVSAESIGKALGKLKGLKFTRIGAKA